MPVHDDRVLFEFLVLEGAQAGLSWSTILNKRAHYRRAFAGFDPAKVARFTTADVDRLVGDAGIVRNRQKIESAVANARAFLRVQAEHGSFDRYVWSFVGGAPKVNGWRMPRQVPARTAGVRRAEQGPEAPRLQLRGLDDLLRVHAGGGDGERSPGALRVLPRTTAASGARRRCGVTRTSAHSLRADERPQRAERRPTPASTSS